LNLRDAWESEAAQWAAWAREPDHDSFWYFGLPNMLAVLPPPPDGLTLDVGCGEGRLPRELIARGYRVVGIEGSPTLASLAATHEQPTPVASGDAAALPIAAESVDLVVSNMTLQDVDDMSGAVREIARVLVRGGRLLMSVVHPINSGGEFESDDPSAPLLMRGSYFETRRYVDTMERKGLSMTFHSLHHSLETYMRALEDAGLLVEAIREPAVTPKTSGTLRVDRWSRMPLFLYVRAVKPSGNESRQQG
jgi:SAM-dependent methyltransferase